MMAEPSKPKERDEICPMCKRSKSKHTNEEMLTCSRKMKYSEKNKTDGA